MGLSWDHIFSISFSSQALAWESGEGDEKLGMYIIIANFSLKFAHEFI